MNHHSGYIHKVHTGSSIPWYLSVLRDSMDNRTHVLQLKFPNKNLTERRLKFHETVHQKLALNPDSLTRRNTERLSIHVNTLG